MTTLDAETMHRLAKLALDAGDVATPEEALELFSRYRLRILLGDGWADTLAGQACFVTALNTAARAFLGGVEVTGDVSPLLGVPLFTGRDARSVVEELGGEVSDAPSSSLPTLVVGAASVEGSTAFQVRASWDHWCARIGPAAEEAHLSCQSDNPLSGIAAAALAVNEAFLYVRGDSPEAGHRRAGLSLWNPMALTDGPAGSQKGPPLQYLPKALWLVGLGHLGQAYAWTLGMLPYPAHARPQLTLQDFDRAAKSNLSTCMLLAPGDLGKRKVRVVANRLEAAGYATDLVERRFGPHHRLMPGEPTTALFGVDNIAARRELDSADFAMTVEAGLGSGYRDFRCIRTHTFPGPRRPSDIWPADAGAQARVELNDAYKKLAEDRSDLCGMTQLASRAVATPFVGAMAAALVLAEVIRPLHGGGVHSALDVNLKDLRHRTGANAAPYSGVTPAFVDVPVS